MKYTGKIQKRLRNEVYAEKPNPETSFERGYNFNCLATVIALTVFLTQTVLCFELQREIKYRERFCIFAESERSFLSTEENVLNKL